MYYSKKKTQHCKPKLKHFTNELKKYNSFVRCFFILKIYIIILCKLKLILLKIKARL